MDDGTLEYLRGTGRPASVVERVERYTKEQGLFRTDETPDPEYTARLEIDLSTVEPSVAGPKRPQDRIALTGLRSSFRRDLPGLRPGIPLPQANGGSAAGGATASANGDRRTVEVDLETGAAEITDGTLVIAAITSCTNTSNPSVMVGAGLLARNAVARGLAVPHWVKTSMAPGSKVVSDYLDAADLTRHLDALGFNVVGYGCTTCIGNSGPLPEPIISAVENQGLVVTSALSGNRNYEARIHQQIRGNYLASPILVVAFALAGRIDIDFAEEPLGTGDRRRTRLPCRRLGRHRRKSATPFRARSGRRCTRAVTRRSSRATTCGSRWRRRTRAGSTTGIRLRPTSACPPSSRG